MVRPLLGCTSENELRWQKCVVTRFVMFEEAFTCGVGSSLGTVLRWERPVPPGFGLSWVWRV